MSTTVINKGPSVSDAIASASDATDEYERGTLFLDSDDALFMIVEDASGDDALAWVWTSGIDLSMDPEFPLHVAPKGVSFTVTQD